MANRRLDKTRKRRKSKQRRSKSRKSRRERASQFKYTEARKYIKNFSDHKLSDNEVILLGRGLKFSPLPKSVKSTNALLIDFKELARKMRCRYLFGNFSSDKQIHPFYQNTNFDPKYCGNNAIENYIFATQMEISKLTKGKQCHNMSKTDRMALISLSMNKNIVIKKADKSNMIVIMNKENYMEEGLRQLQDDKHYVPIENHSTEHIIEKIIEKINTMYNDGSIDSTTYKYLVDMKRTGPGKLYLLPKIHKLQQDDFDKYVGRKALLNHHLIPSRPIISQCNSPTMKIGRFIDNFLVPLVQKQETYLKDTKDFINKIEGITLPPKTMLVSYDVTSMYTNMTFGELLEAVERAIPSEHKTDTLPMPPREDITYLLKILLENNEFQFGKQYYKQVIGAAMGAVPSPEICDLRMYEILKCIIERYPYRNSILLHYRYRDDGFMVFACSHEQIKLFFEIANAEHEYLKFTYNTSRKQR
ncbi:uncharacterized protein [Argopecten irradians]|uniref:uncharacterized protein n=1 Tax=Argopecten irradians TaxID=31199 RepID=UPI003720CF5C